MPEVVVSLAQRRRLRRVALHLFIKMIVRPRGSRRESFDGQNSLTLVTLVHL
jgi:hypothetical protein